MYCKNKLDPFNFVMDHPEYEYVDESKTYLNRYGVKILPVKDDIFINLRELEIFKDIDFAIGDAIMSAPTLDVNAENGKYLERKLDGKTPMDEILKYKAYLITIQLPIEMDIIPDNLDHYTVDVRSLITSEDMGCRLKNDHQVTLKCKISILQHPELKRLKFFHDIRKIFIWSISMK